jgi:hypothetical protein
VPAGSSAASKIWVLPSIAASSHHVRPCDSTLAAEKNGATFCLARLRGYAPAEVVARGGEIGQQQAPGCPIPAPRDRRLHGIHG